MAAVMIERASGMSWGHFLYKKISTPFIYKGQPQYAIPRLITLLKAIWRCQTAIAFGTRSALT